MSWLFGKKKNKESPTDSSEEATSSQADDYIIIENQGNPFGPISQTQNGGPSSSGPGGLYPFLGDGTRNPPPLPYPVTQLTSNDNTQSYLSGVPFKLNERFENDKEIDRIHVNEIFAFILGIQNENYDYDFTLENCVMNEMQSVSE